MKIKLMLMTKMPLLFNSMIKRFSKLKIQKKQLNILMDIYCVLEVATMILQSKIIVIKKIMVVGLTSLILIMVKTDQLIRMKIQKNIWEVNFHSKLRN